VQYIQAQNFLTACHIERQLAADLGTGDGAKLRELFAQHLIIDGVIKVLDVQVHALVTVDSFHLEPLKLLLQLRVTLGLLLSSANVDDMSIDLLVIQLVHGLETCMAHQNSNYSLDMDKVHCVAHSKHVHRLLAVPTWMH